MKREMRAGKRVLSLVIAVLLVVCAVPINNTVQKAHAATLGESHKNHVTTNNLMSIGVSNVYTCEQLTIALNTPNIDKIAVPAGTSIELTGDIAFTIPEFKSLLIYGSLTDSSTHIQYDFSPTIMNYGNITVFSGGVLTLSCRGTQGNFSIANNGGTVDVQKGATLNITVEDYMSYGIRDYVNGGKIVLSGNVNVSNTGYKSYGIRVFSGSLDITDGYIKIDNELDSIGIESKNITISGGTIDINNDFLSIGLLIRNNALISGGLLNCNVDYGIINESSYSEGGLKMAGGKIIVDPDATNGFINASYSQLVYIEKKDCITGPIVFESASPYLYYGTIINVFNKETGDRIERHSLDNYSGRYYDYHGKRLYFINADANYVSISADNYVPQDYLIEPVTDAQQIREIYLQPYHFRAVSADHLTIQKGSSKSIDIDLGSHQYSADYALITSNDEGIATVSHNRIDTNGTITVTGVGNGSTSVKVVFKGGGYDTEATVSVLVPYEFDVESVKKPENATLLNNQITATVPNNITHQEIEVTVSENASWELYSDQNCTEKVINKTMTLAVGVNNAYIKVASKNKESKIYTVVITRADSINQNGGATSSSGGGGGGGGGGGSTPALPVDEKKAVADTTSALTSAQAKGQTSATVVYNSVSEVKLTTLQKMAAQAKKMGGTIYLRANTYNNGKLAVRITLDAAKATKDIKLTGSLTNAGVTKTKKVFENTYQNKVAVISLDQKEDFGMTVRITSPVDLTGLDTKNLLFCSYSRKTGRYTPISKPNYGIDAKGNLSFDTFYGDEIVITDKAWTKK
ncbi:MAG: cadherin-like beta sandwich domain-containing protein [Oscillospiraceae bacterium]|nr:cadherin-like beta sandwich domain-containing protein [Oscillospiraceae bacterium]